ncbi:hypothetical protein [Desulfoluna spongiiphila]|uniref:IrrE N-terminal-like domain-containing protein n=1 Tax=Desulfoluna spongiiphila TaxID=419481 RepID=A0A1G5CHJ5_9BACT|nr:hypothetical protein [Desulfoluna spongiiphila]SCY01797.1 hypothetical protein SAMN05216233_10322 [Desulfoluna spongiiphila]
MSLVYNAIFDLEKKWQGFNRKPFSKNDLIQLAGKHNIIVLEDNSVLNACALRYKADNIILYNPHQPDIDLILGIGHELGHFSLGHVMNDAAPLHANYLSNSAKEKDAGIIGFLFWAPTPDLYRMKANGCLNLEEVYSNCRNNCYGDITGVNLETVCSARLRIYNALIKSNKPYPKKTHRFV